MKITAPTATSFRKQMLLLWSFAIIWLYIGNIINFHQHRIWGKQLLPVAITSQRSKEKDAIKSLAKDNGKAPLVEFSATPETAEFLQVHRGLTSFVSVIPHFRLPSSEAVSGASLRAPPFAG